MLTTAIIGEINYMFLTDREMQNLSDLFLELVLLILWDNMLVQERLTTTIIYMLEKIARGVDALKGGTPTSIS